MNAADLALKALAQKATPGPWELDGDVVWPAATPIDGTLKIMIAGRSSMKNPSMDVTATSAYIAACSPERILSLLARLERMEQALKRGIGAIEACAMQGRGIPANWDAINATQDEMRAALEGATEREWEMARMDSTLRLISASADTLSPQEFINVCADALGVDRHQYDGECDPNRSIYELTKIIPNTARAEVKTARLEGWKAGVEAAARVCEGAGDPYFPRAIRTLSERGAEGE